MSLPRPADGPRREVGREIARLGWVIETLLYLAGALLLAAGAVLVLGDAISALWKGASTSTRASLILDRVLLMFVLVEVLHTVRFAIAGHRLQAEPFLVVALIACVRRVLVLTAGTQPIIGRETLVELGLLIVLLLVSAGAIFLLRMRPPRA